MTRNILLPAGQLAVSTIAIAQANEVDGAQHAAPADARGPPP